MSDGNKEQFRLVFAGEVADGQHPAVVKKRLTAALKLQAGAADKLFAGDPVVVKKVADRETAARLQRTFREAGARLRVQSLATETNSPPTSESPAPAASAESAEASLEVLPQQALPAREPPPAVDVDVSHLSLAAPGIELLEPGQGDEAGDVIVPDPDFELLAPGEGSELDTAVEAVVVDVDFDLAAVGETLAEPSSTPPPPAPDVSHLDIVEPSDDESIRSG